MPPEMLSATVPLAMSAAAFLVGGRVRRRRRTLALNRALHELRRPLQALALASSDSPGFEPVLEALADLDAEINGARPYVAREQVEVRHIARSVVERWARAARSSARRPSLRWGAGSAQVLGNRVQLTRALDNLVANAIEHGRGPIEMRAAVRRDRLRILVRDGGGAGRDPAAGVPRDPRRGHGLAVVREVASSHGGRFVLRSAPGVTLAVLELPLAGVPGPVRATA